MLHDVDIINLMEALLRQEQLLAEAVELLKQIREALKEGDHAGQS